MMRRLILAMAMTLDGFIGGPNGETDWRFRNRDEGAKRWIEDSLWQVGLHIMGRKTFEVMAGYWPTSTDPIAGPMNEIPKAVFTRQNSWNLNTVPTTPAQGDANPASSASAKSWAEAEVINGDLTTEINRLKQQPGKDIVAHGGFNFAQSLAASGLIDEYRFLVHPVVLGSGYSLFAQITEPLDLELRGTTLYRSGVTAQIYWPK